MCFFFWLVHQHSISKAYKYDLFLYSHSLIYWLLDCKSIQCNERQWNIFFYETNFLSSDFCFATNIILLYKLDLCSKSFKTKSILQLSSIQYQLLSCWFFSSYTDFSPIHCHCQTHHISICFILLLLRNKFVSLCRVPMCQLC